MPTPARGLPPPPPFSSPRSCLYRTGTKEPLLDSSCFTPSDWTRIAEDIGRAYHSYDGFVVCMGTDTMAYAASALSFMLENLGKTVSWGKGGGGGGESAVVFTSASKRGFRWGLEGDGQGGGEGFIISGRVYVDQGYIYSLLGR